MLENITESQMNVVEQAVISLPKLLDVVCAWSEEGGKLIKMDSTLNWCSM